ncbi:hypothetical protein DFJ58DRAFT_842469 [Suillus subalutaceus]|uniref:uncharacterized protein n=1 Tax=Suillus subalutaceus TaxID=48586 RepID=UPI001B88737C|nr:uncharacterized protein DFJ58DRAFT_842469 [Suillus subalutaceus]KAG1850193.1 hypothetical protein DFJ58DRAFT_842469 [Suillus subalutaceus]
MDDNSFLGACANVHDFLSRNSGNFHFATTIEDDALTLSFYPSNYSSTDDSVSQGSSYPPTPAYSPVQWTFATGQEDHIVSPAQDQVPTNAFDTCLVPSPFGLEALPGPGCHLNKDSASSEERDELGGDSESEEGGASTQGEISMPNGTLNDSHQSNGSSVLRDSSNLNATPVSNGPSVSNATSVLNGIAISADVPALTISNIPTMLTVQDASRVSVEDRSISTNTTLPAESAERSTVSLDTILEDKPGEPSHIAGFYDVLSRIIGEAGYSLHDNNNNDTIEDNVDMKDGTTSEQVQSVPLVDSSNVSSKANKTPPIHANSLVRSSAIGEDNEPVDIYFVRPALNIVQPGQPLPTDNVPPTPPSSTESFTPVDDIPKLELPKPNLFSKMTPFYQVHLSTVLDGISPRDANTYLTSEVASFSDFHSVYFHHVANAIASYCFCQDQLISIDWEVESYQNDDYPGHKTLTAGNIDLPSGARMLSEASNMLPILKCDKRNVIKSNLPKSFFIGRYNEVNPFITPREARHFNAIIAVARFHGEDEFASKLKDSLLMPFPDEDTIGAMAECDLLDTGSNKQIIQFARDRDKVLNVKRSSIVVIATSPFRTEYFDGPSSLPSTWYELSGIDYDEEDFKGSEKCTRAPSKMVRKFFL